MHKVSDKNRRARKEALREELQSREYIRQIHLILEKPDEEIDVAVAKLKMDGYFKLLAKTLPDLKAVEHTGGGGGPLQVFVTSYADTDTE